MRRSRLALVLSPLLGVALATGSLAAPTKTPQVKDAKGDAVGAQPSMDVVSVLYSTSGRGTGRSYVPKALNITLTLAGPVATHPGVSYEVDAMTDTCGLVTFTYSPATPGGNAVGRTGWAQWDRCMGSDGASSVELISPTVEGSTIRWEFSLKAAPVKVGTTFRDFVVRVDPSNPVIPYPSKGDGGINTGLGLIDAAKGSGSWKLS